MWGIALIDADGETMDEVVFPGPMDTIREWCRACLESRPNVRVARLRSPDGLLEFVYADPGRGGIGPHSGQQLPREDGPQSC